MHLACAGYALTRISRDNALAYSGNGHHLAVADEELSIYTTDALDGKVCKDGVPAPKGTQSSTASTDLYFSDKITWVHAVWSTTALGVIGQPLIAAVDSNYNLFFFDTIGHPAAGRRIEVHLLPFEATRDVVSVAWSDDYLAVARVDGSLDIYTADPRGSPDALLHFDSGMPSHAMVVRFSFGRGAPMPLFVADSSGAARIFWISSLSLVGSQEVFNGDDIPVTSFDWAESTLLVAKSSRLCLFDIQSGAATLKAECDLQQWHDAPSMPTSVIINTECVYPVLVLFDDARLIALDLSLKSISNLTSEFVSVLVSAEIARREMDKTNNSVNFAFLPLSEETYIFRPKGLTLSQDGFALSCVFTCRPRAVSTAIPPRAHRSVFATALLQDIMPERPSVLTKLSHPLVSICEIQGLLLQIASGKNAENKDISAFLDYAYALAKDEVTHTNGVLAQRILAVSRIAAKQNSSWADTVAHLNAVTFVLGILYIYSNIAYIERWAPLIPLVEASFRSGAPLAFPPDTFHDTCPACGADVPAGDASHGTCVHGHRWLRCAVSLAIVQTPRTLCCTGCSRRMLPEALGPNTARLVPLCPFCGSEWKSFVTSK